jgi:hypothetical protein
MKQTQIVAEYVKSMLTLGYAVLPYAADAAALERQFDGIISTMPDMGRLYPIGGFSAFGNAGSFHHQTVRALREDNYKFVKPLLAAVYPGYNIELLVDRLTWREAGRKPTAEAYHRDLTPKERCLEDDIILGGWLNMNGTQNQYFICVPGTHTEVTNYATGSGFAKMTTEQIAEIKRANSTKTVTIPPGHILLFDQRLVHLVNAKANSFDIKRKHLNFRLTHSNEPMIGNIEELLQSGAIIPLKSGQQSPMFPGLYNVNWPSKLVKSSKPFPKAMKENRYFNGKSALKQGLDPNKRYRVLKRFCPSLTEMGIPFVAYSAREIALYKPHAM